MLQVKELFVSFQKEGKINTVISDLSFKIKKNSITALVGESGSGKSMTALAIMGLLPKNATVKGSIYLNDQSLFSMNQSEWNKFRGNKIAMIFQEPMSSLNPTTTCGEQVAEILKIHTQLSKEAIKNEVIALFTKVKLPRVNEMYKSYPHQISGGQKQRVMIAMALACKPQLLIADEPTTALDVTVQKEIIALLKEIQKENKMSVLFISHDLALVSEIADDIIVMFQGKMIEKGQVSTLFKNPKENYTKALLFSKPSLTKRLKVLPTVKDFQNEAFKEVEIGVKEREKLHNQLYRSEPLLRIENLSKYYIKKGSWVNKSSLVKAVDEVSFSVYEGETLGLVGESGCGKTTLGRTILQLEKIEKGHVYFQGKDITVLTHKEKKKLRREIQIIFQDPFSSLNPRLTVGAAILEPMSVHSILDTKKERIAYVKSLLQKVGLEASHFNRYPHEFSGGQRQRIGIARALSLQPKIIICDESVSALDVSVQAQVLNLLNKLKEDFGFTYIFISHDLSVVKYMSDQLVVMNQGRVEEIGEADSIYRNPKSEYTKKLISSIPEGI